jgi:hypothetical protein
MVIFAHKQRTESCVGYVLSCSGIVFFLDFVLLNRCYVWIIVVSISLKDKI